MNLDLQLTRSQRTIGVLEAKMRDLGDLPRRSRPALPMEVCLVSRTLLYTIERGVALDVCSMNTNFA